MTPLQENQQLRLFMSAMVGNPTDGESPEAEQEVADLSEKRGRVLIVEDEYFLSLVAEDALTEAGYDVAVATSAAEGISRAVAERPHLIVMDIHLGSGPNGIFAATEILRQTNIRSLFATAHYDAATKRSAEPASPLGWLSKPYDPSAIVLAVDAAIKKANET